MVVVDQPDLLDVFGRRAPSDTVFNVKKMGFALRGLLMDLWVVTVNTGFILCYDPPEEVSNVADIIEHFLVHTCHCICVFMSSCSRNSVENPCMFKSLPRVCRLILYGRSNLPVISGMVLHYSLFIMLWTSSAFCCV